MEMSKWNTCTVAEVLELSGNAAKDQKKKTINPRHIMLGMNHYIYNINFLCFSVPEINVICITRCCPIIQISTKSDLHESN